MTTLDLRPGDRVTLPGGIVRTVAEISPTGYVNSRDELIYAVRYAEGRTAEWSSGNSATGSKEWRRAS